MEETGGRLVHVHGVVRSEVEEEIAWDVSERLTLGLRCAQSGEGRDSLRSFFIGPRFGVGHEYGHDLPPAWLTVRIVDDVAVVWSGDHDGGMRGNLAECSEDWT